MREFRARHGAVTQAIGYDKVLMLFHMLRQRMGDERFVAGAAAPSTRSTASARPRSRTSARAMSAAAGEDLAPVLRASGWTGPARPRSASSRRRWWRAAGARALELTLAQTQAGEPYALDVPVVPHAARRRRRR